MRSREAIILGVGSAVATATILFARDKALADPIPQNLPTPTPTPNATCSPSIRWGEKGETPGTTIIEGNPDSCVYTMTFEDVSLSLADPMLKFIRSKGWLGQKNTTSLTENKPSNNHEIPALEIGLLATGGLIYVGLSAFNATRRRDSRNK